MHTASTGRWSAVALAGFSLLMFAGPAAAESYKLKGRVTDTFGRYQVATLGDAVEIVLAFERTGAGSSDAHGGMTYTWPPLPGTDGISVAVNGGTPYPMPSFLPVVVAGSTSGDSILFRSNGALGSIEIEFVSSVAGALSPGLSVPALSMNDWDAVAFGVTNSEGDFIGTIDSIESMDSVDLSGLADLSGKLGDPTTLATSGAHTFAGAIDLLQSNLGKELQTTAGIAGNVAAIGAPGDAPGAHTLFGLAGDPGAYGTLAGEIQACISETSSDTSDLRTRIDGTNGALLAIEGEGFDSSASLTSIAARARTIDASVGSGLGTAVGGIATSVGSGLGANVSSILTATGAIATAVEWDPAGPFAGASATPVQDGAQQFVEQQLASNAAPTMFLVLPRRFGGRLDEVQALCHAEAANLAAAFPAVAFPSLDTADADFAAGKYLAAYRAYSAWYRNAMGAMPR